MRRWIRSRHQVGSKRHSKKQVYRSRLLLEKLEDRIVMAVGLNEFGYLSPQTGPFGIVAGPDGNLWFTESSANQIGRVAPDGTIAEFPLPTKGGSPQGITLGPDGNLWFT